MEITIPLETTIKIDPDMTNTTDTTVILGQIQEIILILEIDLQAIVIEIILTPVEITSIHTVVLLNQDNMIDPDTIAQIQTLDPIINPLSIMLNLLRIFLILKLKTIHHLK